MSAPTDPGSKPVSPLDRLHEFSRRNILESVQEIIKADKKLLNAESSNGYTALHYASLCGSNDVVSFLLKEKALVDCSTHTGDTPLHLATWKDHTDTVKLLLQTSPNKNIKNKEGKFASDLIHSDGMRAVFPVMDEKEIKSFIKMAKEEDDDDEW